MNNKNTIRMLKKLDWTFDEFIKPAFEELVRTHSYTLSVYDVWVVKLFDKQSRVQCSRWGGVVDKTTNEVVYHLTLAYVEPDFSTIIVQRSYFWKYNLQTKQIIWTPRCL